ncbi:hypothetical protein HanLR1_Chr12g0461811 [Helianthus annuus]|nr:hypothetical protein HanLR1_Chr12g0461811 [Helianthus annuus]
MNNGSSNNKFVDLAVIGCHPCLSRPLLDEIPMKCELNSYLWVLLQGLFADYFKPVYK